LRERPHVLVGGLGFVGLTVLAMTSSRWGMRRLGKRWKKVHRLGYLIVILALLHMLWVVRADAARWFLYAGIAMALFFLRVPAVTKTLASVRSRKGRGE